MKDTMEIIGRIAYLAQVNEWKRVEQIINETKRDALLHAAKIAATQSTAMAIEKLIRDAALSNDKVQTRRD
jgi:endonuclease III-like uncharacterized protein